MPDEELQKKTERLHMLMTPDELKLIDDWRYSNRVASRSEAVRRLCQIGLALEPLIEKADQYAKETMESWPARPEISGKNILHSFLMAKVLATLKTGDSVEDALSQAKEEIRLDESIDEIFQAKD
jgi:hypothetical protein